MSAVSKFTGYFAGLNEDVMGKLFSCLGSDVVTLVKLSGVSKSWNSYIGSKIDWAALLIQDFPTYTLTQSSAYEKYKYEFSMKVTLPLYPFQFRNAVGGDEAFLELPTSKGAICRGFTAPFPEPYKFSGVMEEKRKHPSITLTLKEKKTNIVAQVLLRQNGKGKAEGMSVTGEWQHKLWIAEEPDKFSYYYFGTNPHARIWVIDNGHAASIIEKLINNNHPSLELVSPD